jgi:hypothetical protein
VTGTGAAPKAQIGYMVRALLNLDVTPTPADTADALAVALCHLHHATSPGSLQDRAATKASGRGAGGTGGLAATSEADWLARVAPTSPWRGP